DGAVVLEDGVDRLAVDHRRETGRDVLEVVGRPGRRLDVGGEAQAQAPALGPGGGPGILPPAEVDDLEGLLQGPGGRHADVETGPGHHPGRELLGPDDVAAANLGPAEAELGGDDV